MLKQGVNYDEIEKYVSQEDVAKIRGELITCPSINNTLSGTICELSNNHAKSVFIPTTDMAVDEHGLIHEAFIFSAANYVAQAAINKEYSILISSRSSFYAPLKFGEVLLFEAQALFDETSKKREVRVIGHVNEIKIFESSMNIVVTDEHIFKLKRPPSKNVKPEEKEKSTENSDEAMATLLLNQVGGI